MTAKDKLKFIKAIYNDDELQDYEILDLIGDIINDNIKEIDDTAEGILKLFQEYGKEQEIYDLLYDKLEWKFDIITINDGKIILKREER